MSKRADDDHGPTILKYFIGGGITILGLLVGYGLLMQCFFQGNYPVQGQFGDQFGTMNALFSGLAFLGLVLTIFFQSRDLRAQTRALELQQEALRQQIDEFRAQKDEMERSAGAQEEYNKLTRIMILVETRKMRVDVALKNAEFGTSQTDRQQRVSKAADIVANTASDIDRLLQEMRPEVEGDPPPKTT